jgi:hypothetical protein
MLNFIIHAHSKHTSRDSHGFQHPLGVLEYSPTVQGVGTQHKEKGEIKQFYVLIKQGIYM